MCARICHDLVSPIGALGAALEVLSDESNADMHDDAMDLVKNLLFSEAKESEFHKIKENVS